ncbi:MAG: Ig-like domain-containing protein, partial [Candidatus Poribacteria bacterium]
MGKAGDTIRVTGANSATATVQFTNPVTSALAFTTILRNATNFGGLFQGEFTVPPLAGGEYDVTIGTMLEDVVRPVFTVQATMTVSPDRLRVGESLFVSGAGFGTTGGAVSISVGGARTPVVVPTTASGRFTAEFPMPRTAGGPTQVTVTDQVRVLSAPVEVLPDVTGVELDPAVAVDGRTPVGSDVRILAVGFGPSEDLDVFVASRAVDFRRSPTSGSDGSVDVTVAIPATTAGRHTVQVLGKTSGLSAVIADAIDILPVLDAPRPARGAVGTTVILTGTGFGPGELVLLELGGASIGETTSENDGTFGAEAIITTATPDGVYDMKAIGATSGAEALLVGAFDYADSKAPTIAVVEVALSNDPLEIGDTITVSVVQAMDYDVITEATVAIGDLSAVLTDDDGDLVWEGVIGIETGLSMTAVAVEVALTDLAGNAPQAVTNSANYSVDTKEPLVSNVVMSDSALKVGETSTLTITFSEAVTGFDNNDITLANGTLTAVSSADSGVTWTGTFTPTDDMEDATNVISVGTAWTDLVGNAPLAGGSTANYVIDTKEPLVSSVVMSDSALLIGETSTLTITFSEAVTNFDNTDITLANGTLTAVSSGDGGITW